MKKTALAVFLIFLTGPGFAQIPGYKTAVFAAGSFWSAEGAFDGLPGVMKTTVGFTGGSAPDPSYHTVTNGGTGHRQAVQVTYDPKKVTYRQLLARFFYSIDPLDQGGQFCDRGIHYTTAIFYGTETEREVAARVKLEMENELGRPLSTRIIAAAPFFPAEDFHQDYHLKQSYKYKFYRGRCGHDKRLKELWGKKAVVPEGE